MKHVKIYTDGACSGNPGPGGFGAVLIYNGFEKEISGYEPETTNNRMELLAAISALRLLKEPCSVDLYSDSAYLINAFEKGWIHEWSKNGWYTKSNKLVKNIDLWQELLRQTQTHEISFIKVKGHSDNKYNNLCDFLAVSQIQNNR